MDKIIVAAEALLTAMREADETGFAEIVADGRDGVMLMLDRLAEAGAVDDEDEGSELVDLLMAG